MHYLLSSFSSCRGDGVGEVEDKTQKPVKAEVFTDLDVAAAVGLMPESLSTSAVPLWFDQELLKAVAGSQVFFALPAEEILPYDLLYSFICRAWQESPTHCT